MTDHVTVRQLSREPGVVLERLAGAPRGLIVTRDGVEVARITPLSAVERAWRDSLREAGHDPDAYTGVADPPLRVEAPGLTDALLSRRNDER